MKLNQALVSLPLILFSYWWDATSYAQSDFESLEKSIHAAIEGDIKPFSEIPPSDQLEEYLLHLLSFHSVLSTEQMTLLKKNLKKLDPSAFMNKFLNDVEYLQSLEEPHKASQTLELRMLLDTPHVLDQYKEFLRKFLSANDAVQSEFGIDRLIHAGFDTLSQEDLSKFVQMNYKFLENRYQRFEFSAYRHLAYQLRKSTNSEKPSPKINPNVLYELNQKIGEIRANLITRYQRNLISTKNWKMNILEIPSEEYKSIQHQLEKLRVSYEFLISHQLMHIAHPLIFEVNESTINSKEVEVKFRPLNEMELLMLETKWHMEDHEKNPEYRKNYLRTVLANIESHMEIAMLRSTHLESLHQWILEIKPSDDQLQKSYNRILAKWIRGKTFEFAGNISDLTETELLNQCMLGFRNLIHTFNGRFL